MPAAAADVPRAAGERAMRLSPRHIEALRLDMPDPGMPPLPGFRPADDADYAAVVAQLLTGAPSGDFWVFAYGSLIWNPAYEHVETRRAVARGWRRTFCLGWDLRFRGNPEAPGLMLALDRGGQCTGVVHRLGAEGLGENLDRLVRREMSMVPTAFPPRWIRVTTPQGPLQALTFAMNRRSGRYIADLGPDALADILARARGFRGSMAEYLHATVCQLEAMGIEDRYLWRLQELVAQRIERDYDL
jgi:cation transport protein ChaC